MKAELEGLPPEAAAQQITAHPNAIELEHWREMFLSYATNGRGRVTLDKIKDWHHFTRFIEGNISAEEYYGQNRSVRTHCENVLSRMGDADQQAYRIELNELINARIRAVRGDSHWTQAAATPSVRMYIDAARLCNSDVMNSAENWEIKKFRTPNRASYEADVQEKMADAFDEAMLSPTMRPENLSGFAVAVIKRRLIDLHRSRLGRDDSARATRPNIVSLNAAKFKGDSRDVSLLDTLDERNLHHTHHELDAEGVIDAMRDYAATLPDHERRLLTAYLDEKAEDPKASNKKISEGLGIKEPTFRGQILRIIEKMGRRNPVVREYLQNRAAVDAHFHHEDSAPKHTSPAPQPQSSVERNVKTRHPLSESMRALKDRMRALFIDEANPVTLSQIAGEVQLSHMVVLSGLMGANNKSTPGDVGALSDNVRSKLSTYLESHGRADRLGEFEEIFSQMRKESGYVGKIRHTPTRSAGGFAIE